MTTDIVVKNVDVPMLREQRDALVAAINDVWVSSYLKRGTSAAAEKQTENLEGVVNLLDAMLDTAEGF